MRIGRLRHQVFIYGAMSLGIGVVAAVLTVAPAALPPVVAVTAAWVLYGAAERQLRLAALLLVGLASTLQLFGQFRTASGPTNLAAGLAVLLALLWSAFVMADPARRTVRERADWFTPERLLDALPVGVVAVAARARRFLFANERTAALASVRAAADPAAALRDAGGAPLPPERHPLNRALDSGETVQGEEVRAQTPDGAEVTLLVSAAPVHGSSGGVAGAVAGVLDITERAEAERALRVSEEHLRLALDSAGMIAWEYNPETDELCSFGGAGHGLLDGAAPFPATGAALLALIHPDDRAAVLRGRRQALKGEGQEFAYEFRLLLPDGAQRRLRSYGRARRSAPEGGLRLFGVMTDVTEFRQAADERARLNQEKLALLESAGQGIFGVDVSGRCTFINRVGAEMMGYTPEELQGTDLHDVAHHHRIDGSPYPREACPVYRAVMDGVSARVEDEVVWRRDGTAFRAEYSVAPVELDGQIEGAVVTIADVTERLRLEEDRERLLAQEQELRAEAEAVGGQLQALQTVADAALAHLKFDELVQHLLERVRSALRADTASLLLLTGDGQRLAVMGSVGLRKEHGDEVEVPLGQGFAGRIAVERRPLMVEDLAGFPTVSLFLKDRLTSVLGVPLLADGAVIGVLHVGSIRRRSFTANDLRLLELVAARAVWAVQRSRLYDEAQRTRREAERSHRQMALLAEASHLLASSLDYEVTLGRVAHLAVPELADGCVVDLRTDKGAIQRVAAAHVDPELESWLRELQRERPMDPDGPNPVAETIRTGRSRRFEVVSDDILIASARDAASLERMRGLAPLSSMVAPLNVRGRTLGAFTLMVSAERQRYGAGDLALAEELATRAALAIDNARLYRDLERRVAEFQTLLDVLPIAIAVADSPDCRVIHGNRALSHLLGVPERANTSMSGPPEERPRVWFFHDGRELAPEELPVQYAAAHGVEVRDFEVDLVRPDGSVTTLYEYASPLFDERGRVRGCLGAFVDITERKRAEQERTRLLEAERAACAEAEAARRRAAFVAEVSAQLSASLDYEVTLERVTALAVPALADWCASVLTDDDGQVTRTEVACADPDDAALLRWLLEMTPPDPSEKVLQQVLRSGRPALWLESPAWAVRAVAGRDGQEAAGQFQARSLIVVPMLAHGRTLGALVLVTAPSQPPFGPDDLALAEEVAWRAALAVDNARLYQRAQQALRSRDDFLVTAAHDLKNPLTALRGQAQLLQRRMQQQGSALHDARLLEGLRSIEDTTSRMARQINALVDVARLQLGERLPLEPQSTDLVALAGRLVEEHQRGTERHRLRLVRTAPQVVGDWDAPRLERVIGNLLSNAVKYSPGGGDITVTVGREPDPEGGPGAAVVIVRDQGVGIPQTDLPHVLERFHRGSNVVGRFAGAGIGLAGARQIVEEHGGSIEVQSREGQGSAFTVRLPLTPPSDEESGRNPAA